MKTMKKFRFIFFLSITFLGSFSSLWAEVYQIDPVHSSISFKIRHMVISKVRGQFDRFSGEFFYDEKEPKNWKTSANIETASINTANEKRDQHLRTPDFFDAEKYPAITFKSAKISNLKGSSAKLSGLLSMHGVEKPVILDLEIGGVIKDPMGVMRAGFEATTKLNRKDFGIVYNKILESGGLALGEEVEIEIHIEGTAQKKEEK